MDASGIEDAILSVVGDRWKKVAMVIAKASEAIGSETSETYELISAGIEILVRSGRLEAQGNTKNWRFSEVRRPLKPSDQGQ